MKLFLRSFLTVSAVLTFTGAAFASTLGSDNASTYGGSWGDGSNGGTGFGAWTLTSNATAGFFIGNSNGNGSDGSINSSNVAFGMYANNGSNPYANAARPFGGGALVAGQDFSFDMSVNYRNGGKGVNLQAGGSTIFSFITTGDDYVVSNAATGNGSIGNAYSTNTNFHLDFSQTNATGGTWTITRSGGVTDLDTGTYTGDASSFYLTIYGTSTDSQSNLYANNFAITGVPEPSTWLAGFLIVGLAGYRLSRSQRPGVLAQA